MHPAKSSDGQPSALLLEPDGAHGKLLRLLRRQARALGRDCRRDLLQAVLAHGLREDRVGLAERVDAVDQVDIEFAHVHRKPAHAVDQGGVGGRLASSPSAAERNLLGLLRQVEGGDGVLAHGLLVLRVKLRVFVLDDLAHADLRQLLRHQFFVEQAALDGGLVLNEGGDHLVQVFLADARGLLALGFGEPLDLNLELPGLLVEADVALARVVAALAVVEARRRAAVLRSLA